MNPTTEERKFTLHSFLKNRLIGVIGVLLSICFSTSCIPSKNLTYFNNISDSQIIRLPQMAKPQAVIMADDLLDIKIAGANEATASLLNTYSIASTGANNATGNNYLVNDDGEIEFPVIGKIKAGGFTKEEFKERLKEKVSKYLKDPLISVRFANFRFTVLGEVKSAGSFIIPNEKVTVLEALGMAGDMTNYSRRNNVRIVRDSSGQREIGALNFTDKALFTSKYYYLKRNDVIYIEADKSKNRFEGFSRLSTVIATLASLTAIAITIAR